MGGKGASAACSRATSLTSLAAGLEGKGGGGGPKIEGYQPLVFVAMYDSHNSFGCNVLVGDNRGQVRGGAGAGGGTDSGSGV